jgi:hypothetical protein
MEEEADYSLVNGRGELAILNLIEIRSVSSWLKCINRRTDTISNIRTQFMHSVQRTSYRVFTASRSLKEKHSGLHRLIVFERGLLRGIFGPTRDEVKEIWIKLHNVEVYNL